MGTVDMKEAHVENTKTVPCTSLMHIHILTEAKDNFVQFALVLITRR